MEAGELHVLAGLAYDAAMGECGWDAVGHALLALVGGRTATFWVGDPRRGEVDTLFASAPPEALRLYAEYYCARDIWTQGYLDLMRARGMGADTPAMIGTELVSESEVRRSEIYNDFMRGFGMFDLVGNVSPLGDAGFLTLGIHRPEDAERYGVRERDLLGLALPHLRRALRLRHRLKAAEEAPAVLDLLPMAGAVVDAGLRLVQANRTALALAAPGGPLRLERCGAPAGPPLVTAARVADRAVLERLVRAVALGASPGGGMRLSAADGGALALIAIPLPGRLGGGPGPSAPRRVLLLVRNLAGVPPPVPLLRDVFGLGQGEAEVAAALVGGVSAEAVAEARGVAVATVRGQIRSILAKTGASGLRELERMMALLAG